MIIVLVLFYFVSFCSVIFYLLRVSSYMPAPLDSPHDNVADRGRRSVTIISPGIDGSGKTIQNNSKDDVKNNRMRHTISICTPVMINAHDITSIFFLLLLLLLFLVTVKMCTCTHIC